MASRGEIRDAFYSDLSSCAGTYDVTDETGTVVDTVTLDSSNITLRHPSPQEDVPQIVYHENYTPVMYNDVGRAPDHYEYNPDGTVAAALYYEYVEAQFLIDVRVGGDMAEMRKEPLYESIRTTFGKYERGAWSPTDFHEDATDVWVESSSTADTGDVEDVIRGDQLDIRVEFKRVYRREAANIESVETLMDVGDDGTTDDTHTTN